MNIIEKLKSGFTYFDGGMGTILQKNGLKSGERPETMNITHPEVLTKIHLDYLRSGANVITSNTFGANPFKFDNLEEIISSAYFNAKKAVDSFEGNRDCYIAFDIGPLGKMLEPLGELKFEDAVEAFAKSIRIAVKYGFDLILIETMSDLYDAKAAVLAAKENSSLSVILTNAFDENMNLLTGADPKAVIATLEGLGVDALGINCSLGPRQMKDIAAQYVKYSSLPVVVNPNAGIPQVVDGKTVFDVDAEEFSEIMVEIAELGVCGLGGCCGTTPEYIKKTYEKTKNLVYKKPNFKTETLVASYTHAVEIGGLPKIIGERINPTGKPKLKAALQENDLGYIIKEGITQQEKGAHILDVNVGLAGIDETSMLLNSVRELQSVTDLPLQLDTVRAEALEKALRYYNGKPMINSVNAKEESMKTVFPLAKKYGGVVIALTIGENGIPETAEGRLELAKKIVETAKTYGIDKKDIVVDTLCMAVSANDFSARVTLDSIKLIKEKLGVKTCLGVSNISFALPDRETVNSAFLAMALECGLDCAIMNPCSDSMMRAYKSFCMLNGMDPHCERYIEFALANQSVETKNTEEKPLPDLMYAIVKGLSDEAKQIADKLCKTKKAMEIINEDIVPALNLVGERFEKKELFLPQLLMSAEAASAAFDSVKSSIEQTGEKKAKVVLATVKGDIHDIGKNIVKVLLQSYGYEVIDLGKDVDPKVVLEKTRESKAKTVGLSALMTTTLDSMKETAELLKKELPDVKIIVGGAVLNEEFAKKIGAVYSKDAMQTVNILQANA